MRSQSKRLSALVLLVVAIDFFAIAGERADRTTLLTDTLKADDFRRCGLHKLDRDELVALNAWMVQVYAAMALASAKAEGELAIYDRTGTAVAYLAASDELTIYLWSGQPVAYLKESSIYGFNGKHLGWYERGFLHDGRGKVVGMTDDGVKGLKGFEPKAGGPKGLKKLKPIKAIEAIEPIQPIFMYTWSDLDVKLFLSQGAR